MPVDYSYGGDALLQKNGQIKQAAAIPATLDDRYVKSVLK